MKRIAVKVKKKMKHIIKSDPKRYSYLKYDEEQNDVYIETLSKNKVIFK